MIADEPTTALDASVQAQIIDLTKETCAEWDASVVLITRDRDVIAGTADRVAVLHAGRLAEVEPVRQVITATDHPCTRGLMGSIPMLTLESDRLVQIPGAMPRLNAIPPGCAFNPRCTEVSDRCRVDRACAARPGRAP